MSCIRHLFTTKNKKKTEPDLKRMDSEVYSIVVGLQGPLPDKDSELDILQHQFGKRMSFLKQKSNIAIQNAVYMREKGDMAKYMRYLREKTEYSDEIKKIGIRLTEVVEKRNKLASGPKLETATINPVKNVTNSPPPKMVSSRSLHSTHTHIANILPAQTDDLHTGS